MTSALCTCTSHINRPGRHHHRRRLRPLRICLGPNTCRDAQALQRPPTTFLRVSAAERIRTGSLFKSSHGHPFGTLATHRPPSSYGRALACSYQNAAIAPCLISVPTILQEGGGVCRRRALASLRSERDSTRKYFYASTRGPILVSKPSCGVAGSCCVLSCPWRSERGGGSSCATTFAIASCATNTAPTCASRALGSE